MPPPKGYTLDTSSSLPAGYALDAPDTQSAAPAPMVPQTETQFEKENKGVGRQFGHRMAAYLPAIGGAVGGTVGSVAGAPTGPGAVAAGVGGAILGGGAGEAARQHVDRLLGFSSPKTATEAAIPIGVEGAKQGAYEAGGRLIGAGVGRVAKPLAEKIPAEMLEKYPWLKKLSAKPKSPVSPKAVDYLTAATGAEAHAPIAATIKDISDTIEKMPPADRTVGGFLNVVKKSKDAMNEESGAAMKELIETGKGVVPDPVISRLEKLITPNMEMTTQGRAEKKAIEKAILDFEKPWDYNALDAERMSTRARLNSFHAKESVAQYTAQKASRSLAIDNAIEQGLKETLYPAMDKAAGKPAGYFAKLKGRQANLIQLESLLNKRIESLAGKTSEIAGSPRLSSESLSVSVHPGSPPAGRVHGLRNAIYKPNPTESAANRVAKAFPQIDTMPYQKLVAGLVRGEEGIRQNLPAPVASHQQNASDAWADNK